MAGNPNPSDVIPCPLNLSLFSPLPPLNPLFLSLPPLPASLSLSRSPPLSPLVSPSVSSSSLSLSPHSRPFGRRPAVGERAAAGLRGGRGCDALSPSNLSVEVSLGKTQRPLRPRLTLVSLILPSLLVSENGFGVAADSWRGRVNPQSMQPCSALRSGCREVDLSLLGAVPVNYLNDGWPSAV